ncbi:hypothetical protein V491_06521 [Pseudogymnoascus sp. VKM F-3775]|nr:hypothetical protein V491_06521 [Pseudogymnoascus sp. VKM F-3775]
MKFESSHDDFEVIMKSAAKHTDSIRLASEALYQMIEQDDKWYLYREVLPLLHKAFKAYGESQWIKSGELFLEVWRYTERQINEDTYYSLSGKSALEELGFLTGNPELESRFCSLPILPILGTCAMVDAALCYLFGPSTNSPWAGSILREHNCPAEILLRKNYNFDYVKKFKGESVYGILELCDKIGNLTNDKLTSCGSIASSLAQSATARLTFIEKMGCMSVLDEELRVSQYRIVKPNLAWILVVTDSVLGDYLLSNGEKLIPVLKMASRASSNLCINDSLDIYMSSVSQKKGQA